MNFSSSAGSAFLGCLLAGLLAGLPACTDTARGHPEGARRLLRDSYEPHHPKEAFSPVPEDELLEFELPEVEPYRLGVGDMVMVKVINSTPMPGYGDGLEVRVKEDGTIRLPVAGKFQAAGKTTLELEEELTEPIQAGFVKAAIVSVETTGFLSRRFFVVGEVGSPGTLPVNGQTTLIEALIVVSGTKLETADLDEAYVIRDQQPIPFSVKDVYMRGHPMGRLVMQENDIVFVPHLRDRQEFVYLFGEVAKPSRVPMEHQGPRGTDGTLTLAAALADAGGLNPRADVNQITIYRGPWHHPQRYQIGVEDVYQSGHEIFLQAGDRIAVGTRDSAKFSDAIGPALQLIGAASSGLSLAISAVALSK